MKWQWSNVPVPEAYVVSLVIGVIVHIFLPLKLFADAWIGHAVGWPLIVISVLVVIWAVQTIKDMNISKPTKVITTGPYAFSRNPMYISWIPIYVGVSFIVNTIWPVVLLPAVLIFTHYFNIITEERYLKEKFGDEYQKYCAKVRRYL